MGARLAFPKRTRGTRLRSPAASCLPLLLLPPLFVPLNHTLSYIADGLSPSLVIPFVPGSFKHSASTELLCPREIAFHAFVTFRICICQERRVKRKGKKRNKGTSIKEHRGCFVFHRRSSFVVVLAEIRRFNLN